MSDEVQIYVLRPGPDCLACTFSIERLVECIEADAFTFCGRHMLRASAHLAGLTGDAHLHEVRD